MSSHQEQGFTAIELLIVITIIGIIAAMAIPTLLNAIDRGRQKRTMGDLNAIGMAIQTYAVDYNSYPVATSLSDLMLLLEPEYGQRLPRDDAWSNPLILSASGGLSYTLGSPGKSGGTSLTLIGDGGETQSFDDDIIYANGMFVQWPSGMQR